MLDYRLSQPSTWMLPLLFVALFLCVSPSLSFLFNGTTRWGFLVIGMLWVVSRNQWGMIFRSPLALVTILLFAWPILTVTWSLNTGLSLVKVTGFVAVSCTMFALGAAWAWNRGEQSLNLLVPFMVVYFLILLTAGIPTEVASGYGQLYEGAGNPNLTGIAAAFCVPLVLYRMFVHGGSHRLIWWMILLALIYVLLAALSRNAMLVAGITGFGCLIGMGAIIMDHVQIGEYSIIGAGSLITENKVIPPRHLVMGSPARVIRALTAEEIAFLPGSARHYCALKDQYLAAG